MQLRIISFVTWVIIKNDITPFSETRSCHYRPRWTYMLLSTMPSFWPGGSTWFLCFSQKAFDNLPSSQGFITLFLLSTGLACLIKMENREPLSLNNIAVVWTWNKRPFIIFIHQESWEQVFSFGFYILFIYFGWGTGLASLI